MTKVLVVDDDLALADVLVFTLRRAGFEVAQANDGRQALEQFEVERPDLVVLDWTLPFLNGLEVCGRIRAVSDVPVLMLTVRHADDDVVAALEMGADEYVVKPFSPRQLVARIRSLLRRAGAEAHEIPRAGALTLDVERHLACWEGMPAVHLTRLETRLLQVLLQNADRVLSSEGLITRIWGPGGATNEMLKQLVYRLRTKVEPQDGSPVLIETVPNTGYVLNTHTEIASKESASSDPV